MSENQAEVIFGANIAGAIAGINQLTEKIEGMGSVVSSITSTFSGLGEAVIAAFAIEKIDQFIEKIGDLGLQVERTSQQLGLAVQQVSILNYAAETNDVSTSQMRNSLERLTVGLQSAMEGTNAQADAFKRLAGESAQEFIASGGTMADLIERIAKNTAEMNGKVNLAPSFIHLMGRSGADAIPVFIALGENMDNIKEKVAAAGLAFNPKFIEDIAETRQANIDLKEATSGLGTSLFSILKPAIDVAILGFRGLVQNLQDSAQYGGIVWGVMEGLTGAFLILETAVIAVADMIKLVFQTLLTGINAALAEVQGAAKALYDIAHGHLQQAEDDLKTGNANAVNILKDGGDLISKNTNDTLDKMKKSWSDYWDAITTGSKASNGAVSKGGGLGGGGAPLSGDSSAADNKKLEADLAYYNTLQQIYKEDYDRWMQIEQLKLSEIAQFDGKESKMYQDELKKKIQMEQQHALQSTKIWTTLFDGIAQSGRRMFDGLISGQLTWHNAVRQGLIGIFQSFENMFFTAIETLIKKQVQHYLLAEVTKTEATQAGNTARTASTIAAAETGAAAQAVADHASIMKSASTAAAGAYSATAAIPIIGPFLAPIVAAGAFVATEAFASFDVGTNFVPNDMLAMVHRGEKIITAQDNAMGNNGGNGPSGSGGMAIHFNGPVYGMKDFHQAVAQAVSVASRNFNPNLTRLAR